MMSSDQIIF